MGIHQAFLEYTARSLFFSPTSFIVEYGNWNRKECFIWRSCVCRTRFYWEFKRIIFIGYTQCSRHCQRTAISWFSLWLSYWFVVFIRSVRRCGVCDCDQQCGSCVRAMSIKPVYHRCEDTNGPKIFRLCLFAGVFFSSHLIVCAHPMVLLWSVEPNEER